MKFKHAALGLALILMAGCATAQSGSKSGSMSGSKSGPNLGYARHNNPTVRAQLKGATERYFSCVYQAVDKNIRFAPASETRTVMQAAVEDCRAALKTLRRDVALINIKTSVARGLVESAERHGYSIAREGLRQYYEKTATN